MSKSPKKPKHDLLSFGKCGNQTLILYFGWSDLSIGCPSLGGKSGRGRLPLEGYTPRGAQRDIPPTARLWYITIGVGKEAFACGTARRRIMAWFRVQLTENEQRIVNEERASHPSLPVRDKMWAIWLLHCGVTRRRRRKSLGSRGPRCSGIWTPIAEVDWTQNGARMCDGPLASCPHSAISSRHRSRANRSARLPRRATES